MSVTAAVDNDRVEETVEKYGADPKVTSEAMREEQDRNRMVMGVPGTLSNRPPPAAANPAAANQQTAGGATDPNAAPADGTARKNATTRQYAYDRSITQTKRSRGRLEKLSVAVVLAQAAAPTPKTGWSPADRQHRQNPAQRPGHQRRARRPAGGVGHELPAQGRAGRVVGRARQHRRHQQAPATPRRPARLPAAGASAAAPADHALRPGSEGSRAIAAERRAAEQAAVAAAKEAKEAAPRNRPRWPAPPARRRRRAGLGGGRPAPGMPVVPLLENYDLPPPGSAVDVMVDHLKVLAAKEPERVAEVVKQWMQKNGRTQ
jgi:flagellar M-ring protein FliF